MRNLVSLALCIAVSSAAAQSTTVATATFAGIVTRDSAGNVVSRAAVQLPELNRKLSTNSEGEFEFTNVPPGRHAITVRAIGFEVLIDTIELSPGQRLDADIVLTPTPVTLEAVQTTAAARATRLPPGLQEMEERRKEHLGGYFVTDSTLRAND